MNASKHRAPGIEVCQLQYRLKAKTILQSLSFRLHPGTITALIGKNGAGKSSLLSLLSTLALPAAGSITLAGIDAIRAPRKAREQIGVVFQTAALEPSLSVAENLYAMAYMQGLRGVRIAERLAELMAELEIEPLGKRRVKTLSGGETRKVELARALIHEPPILLLDEPTQGLDPIARHHFWNTLQRLAGKGHTILLATHHTDEAMRASQVMLLDQGKMRCLAPWDELVKTLPPVRSRLPALSGTTQDADRHSLHTVLALGEMLTTPETSS
ncbi:ABC transporter ATP-binding protein [Paludibacterium purpuratum]|uniref:ABC-2 type transport system ATP-binding protein n=1 Tax=Paludibacterium purpuratum TaxID=1144873 RepID=A0A4V3DVM0_9NEIS|nr:ABC transporter ATP-binding protein [Paludibacterium purpuratum]TDR81539.1 ABC-2 type transport system ATP-binding protein [Paludibacterium purpuratum]